MNIDDYVLYPVLWGSKPSYCYVIGTDEDGEPLEKPFPSKVIVCPECQGSGYHLKDSLRGYTWSDIEAPPDYDFLDEMQSGVYDVECSRCRGLRVSCELITTGLTKNEKAILQEYYSELDEDAATEAIYASERRMGA